MATIATSRAEMPAGTNKVLERRTVETDNRNVLKFLKGGISVLDVGCGSGSMTAGMVKYLGPNGTVTGIDINEHLIAAAKQHYSGVKNLVFEVADINGLGGDKKFDLVTSARVLQWLPNPAEVIGKMASLLKPGGWLSILDYNHTKIQWHPRPPEPMRFFYDAFLQSRKDAGFDNEMADNLEKMFADNGLNNISVEDLSEEVTRGDKNFETKAGIWSEVAETRGHQLVRDGYITEQQRTDAIHEYNAWIKEEARMMKMYLTATEGQKA
jgi:ubiquinone/menaquinone biosynthesis C-methylase UbiE